MNCPICKGDTRILRTEGAERRRECIDGCGRKFTTVEVLKEDHQRQQEAVQIVVDVAAKLKAA